MERGNDADEILPGLWLGNAKASQDENFIKKNGIKVVFNCTKNLGFSPIIPVQYRIPVDDNLEEEEIRNMELWSSEISLKIVKEYSNGDPILVHCMAGMQRSAASVAMALIVLLKMKSPDVIKYIKSKRPIAFFPSANFGRSIAYFDNKYHNDILPEIETKIGQNHHVIDNKFKRD
jgi:protein-tyrosine phosphatase